MQELGAAPSPRQETGRAAAAWSRTAGNKCVIDETRRHEITNWLRCLYGHIGQGRWRIPFFMLINCIDSIRRNMARLPRPRDFYKSDDRAGGMHSVCEQEERLGIF